MNAVTCHASVCRYTAIPARPAGADDACGPAAAEAAAGPSAGAAGWAERAARDRYRSWLIHTRVAATAGTPHSPSVIRTEPPVASNSGTLISEAITAPVARLVR